VRYSSIITHCSGKARTGLGDFVVARHRSSGDRRCQPRRD
jgi:hypothetical protein